MSTYWGYVCESHDPHLESDHWFNHGDLELARLFWDVRAGKWVFNEWGEPDPIDHRGYTTTEPVRWLLEHPRCRIALANEYGDIKPLEPQPSDNPPG